MRIKDISKNNRPRERLHKLGPSALSEAELLAIILQKGTSKENVIDMSNRLISRYGLDKLSDCSLTELQGINGIGFAKACQIIAVFELQKRQHISGMSSQPIKSSKDVFEYASSKLPYSNKENFMILHIDSKNRIIKDEIVSIGTLNGLLIHPREIFRSVIKEGANSVILVHNHPSGDATPSEADIVITNRLFAAGKLLDIKILDHVIIGKNDFYSFEEKTNLL